MRGSGQQHSGPSRRRCAAALRRQQPGGAAVARTVRTGSALLAVAHVVAAAAEGTRTPAFVRASTATPLQPVARVEEVLRSSAYPASRSFAAEQLGSAATTFSPSIPPPPTNATLRKADERSVARTTVPPPPQPPIPLPKWNLTGAFRGEWAWSHGEEEHQHFAAPSGMVQHQVAAWRTTNRSIFYVQSALLLYDGTYTGRGDTRISFEGVHDLARGKLVMFSHGGGGGSGGGAVAGSAPASSSSAKCANCSAEVMAYWHLTRFARSHVQRPRNSRRTTPLFVATTTHTKCAMRISFDVQHSHIRQRHSSVSSWSSSSSSGTVGMDAHRVTLNGTVASPNCAFALDVVERSMDFGEHHTKVTNHARSPASQLPRHVYDGSYGRGAAYSLFANPISDTVIDCLQAFYFSVAATAITLCQILLITHQMEFSQSQPATARISVVTIGLQVGMDVFLALFFLTHGVIMEALFSCFATVAFCKFVLVAVFEMRWFATVSACLDITRMQFWIGCRFLAS
jgi:hypothetical protein